jgi:prophage tail gpP-like protein
MATKNTPQGDVHLKVNGVAYYGWKEVTVTKSINNGCGAFSFRSSDKYPNQPQDWSIQNGDKCTVEVEDQIVITGFVDDIIIDYDASNHNLEFVGRDNTCDLVDCNYPQEKTWTKSTLLKMVTDICSLFSIKVAIDPNNSSLTTACNETFTSDQITLQGSDSLFEFISKLCQVKAVLPVCYGDGKLTLTRAGGRGESLNPIQLGYNILKGRAEYLNRDRFSDYYIKAQSTKKVYYGLEDIKNARASSNATQSGSTITSLSRDATITRYRPKTLAPDGNMDTDACKKFANWTRNVTAGNSRKYTYTLVEWIQGDYDGSIRPLWEINTIVQVKDSVFGIDTKMLISAITYFISESEGTTTELTLVDPSAYSLIPFKFDKGGEANKVYYGLDNLKNINSPMDAIEGVNY